MKNRCRVADL